MSFRRLLLVCGLTVADYLLWNWSLSSNHTVLALVSGLTLPFLLLASTVLLALNIARLISGPVRRSQHQAGGPRPSTGRGTGRRRPQRARRSRAAGLLGRASRPATGPSPPEPTSGSAPSAPPSRASSARQRAA
jgi:hypothetical protein